MNLRDENFWNLGVMKQITIILLSLIFVMRVIAMNKATPPGMTLPIK